MVPKSFILHSNITLFTGTEMSAVLSSPFRTEFFVKADRAPRSRPPVEKASAGVTIAAAGGPATTAAEERGQFGQINVISRNKWLLWTI